MRGTGIVCALVGVAFAACEGGGGSAPSDPAGAESEAVSALAESQAPLATPDGTIASGERLPRLEPGVALEQAPDPAAASGLPSALYRLAHRYSGGWIAASPAFEGSLGEGQSQDYQVVLGSAHCYRALGVADSSLEDFDLLLFDDNGVQVQQDQGSDRFPVVGLGYPVCPAAPGAYRLKAAAKSGSGSYRVQVFHTP